MAIGMMQATQSLFATVVRSASAVEALAGTMEELALTGEGMARNNRTYVLAKSVKANQIKLDGLDKELEVFQTNRTKSITNNKW